jgi:hypothetical protein
MTICQICTVDLMAFCFLRYRMQDLRERGHRNVVVCQVDRFRAELEAVADEVIDVPIPRTIQPWRDLVALIRLIRVLRKMKPDVVHTHSSKRASWVAWPDGSPVCRCWCIPSTTCPRTTRGVRS